MRHVLGSPVVLVALLLVGAVFSLDINTPADNVSICFVYVFPILVVTYAGPGAGFLLAGASTLASVLGSIIEPPAPGIVAIFAMNRVIAVLAQWLVAALIEQHKRRRREVQARLEDERRKVENGQRFIRILSHEIATALTAIDGHSYRLAKLAHDIAPADIVARSDKIRAAVGRLNTLVHRVEAASEVDREALAVAPEWIATDEIVRIVGAEFDADGPHALVAKATVDRIFADRALIQQAIANLVSNAVKYSPDAGEIGLAFDRSAVTGGTMVTVADAGVGIPDDELGRVFEPYYRARNTNGIQGLGIGLHLVKHFTEAQGGCVRIESRLDRGTRVSLHLPGGETSAA